MRQLGERDRQAILLRYFANRPYADVGRRLGLSENAARMRVDRALDKLRERLGRRGITSTCAALAAGLSAEAAVAAPAGVAAAVTSAAGAIGTAAAGSGLLLLMSANKITTAAITLFAVGGTATIAVQERANARLAAEVSNLQAQTADIGTLRKENQMLVRTADETRSLAEANQTGDALSDRIKALGAEASGLRQQIVAAADRRRAAAAAIPPPGQVLDISRLDKIPKPVLQGRPTYPFEMRQAGLSGQVVVDFVVDSAGNVHNAFAASSSNPGFEQMAVDAVSQWSFSPGQKSGQTVNTHLQVPIVFVLNNGQSPGQAAPGSNQTPDSNPSDFEVDTPRPGPPAVPMDWFPGGKN
jgi:TonB family protein